MYYKISYNNYQKFFYYFPSESLKSLFVAGGHSHQYPIPNPKIVTTGLFISKIVTPS